MSDPRRQRIARWYSPQAYREWAAVFTKHQSDYLEGAAHREPANFPPESLKQWASRVLEDGSPLPIEEFLERVQPLHSRRVVGHQVAPPVPLASLWDGMGALLNQGAGVYEMSPSASAAEWAVVERLKAKVPWRDGDGFFTSGGTLANLTALLAARNTVLPDAWEKGVDRGAVLVAGADAHYCVARSAGVLGLGMEQVVKVPLDANRRMDPKALETTLDGLGDRKVIAVVATSGSTPVGAYDPLEPIGELCEARKIWLHVDGAHGAGVLFSPALREKMRGVERASSLAWDMHKMMHMPSLSTALLFRNAEHSWRAFHQEAPYLFDPDGVPPRFDGAQRTFECTRRALAVPFWGVLAAAGESLFADMVEQLFELAEDFHSLLEAEPDFAPFHRPQSNIVCFRWSGEGEAKALRRAVLAEGRYYLTQTVVEGQAVLRVALMNPLVELDDLRGLLEEIRRVARTASA